MVPAISTFAQSALRPDLVNTYHDSVLNFTECNVNTNARKYKILKVYLYDLSYTIPTLV